MRFNGFESIAEYEQACSRTGFVTKRIPYGSADQEDGYFVLLTSPKIPSPTSLSTWHLFTVDESRELMSGVVNGYDEKRLAQAGFIPVK